MAHKNYLLHDEFPKAIKNATSTKDGLMSSEDKARLDSVFEFGLLSPATPDKDGLMSKDDKTKLDGIEEGANNYIHPDDSNTRHVTDDQINKWNNQTKYTNENPMPTGIGGLEQGTTFDNMDFNTLITRLLYPYIDPSISNIVITPSTTILEKGTNFTLSRIQFRVTAPSITDATSLYYEFKLNNSRFHVLETNNRTIDESVTTSINDNTSITVTITDKTNNRNKSFGLINYKFIYPFYYGAINTTDSINQSTVISKTKLLQDKSNKTLKFNTNNQKMIFAYPKDYGLLKAIYDANNFNVFNTFTYQEITITGLDSKPMLYYVYSNDASSVTDYNMQFVF